MDRIGRENAFTIVEIMIVVSIIAILMSIGFPSYRMFARKAKSSEAICHLASIRTLQVIYRSINDKYLTLEENPEDIPSDYVEWGDPGGNWDELGFTLETMVRYQYKSEPGSSGSIVTSFMLTAQSDFDVGEPGYDTWTLSNDGLLTHTNRYK